MTAASAPCLTPVTHWRAWWLSWPWRAWRWLGQTDRALLALSRWLAQVSVARSGQRPPALSPVQRLWCHAVATQSHLLGERACWQQSLSGLQALVHWQPDQAAHWFNLGYVHGQMGSAAAAQHAFEQALRLSPRIDAAWLGLASALAEQGLWPRAVTAWVRHTECQPLCPDAFEHLVRVHAAHGATQAAGQWLSRLRAFDPRRAMCLEAALTARPTTRPTPLPIADGAPFEPTPPQGCA